MHCFPRPGTRSPKMKTGEVRPETPVYYRNKGETEYVMERPEILFYKPDNRLLPYVRYYYVLRSRENFRTLTFPIGCPQIIFHKKSPLYIPELKSRQSVFTVSGQVNFPAHVCSAGDTEMIVAVFRPHTVGMFIGVPPSLFYNREISGYDVESKELDKLAARIFEDEDNGRCVRTVEHWLLTRLHEATAPDFSRMCTAVRRLMEAPSTTVGQLADIACLGKKQFERVFFRSVGMKPKEYARVVRFQKTLWMMQNGRRADAGMAYTNGYADQAHMIREFKLFSGFTPRRLRDGCLPHSDLFACPV